MKSYTTVFRAMTILVIMAVTPMVHATTNVWTGFTNQVWHVPGNWAPSGPPNASAEVRFVDLATGVETVTNNVTVNRLWFGQTNGTHEISISPGVQFNVIGTEDNGWGPLGSDPASQAP